MQYHFIPSEYRCALPNPGDFKSFCWKWGDQGIEFLAHPRLNKTLAQFVARTNNPPDFASNVLVIPWIPFQFMYTFFAACFAKQGETEKLVHCFVKLAKKNANTNIIICAAPKCSSVFKC